MFFISTLLNLQIRCLELLQAFRMKLLALRAFRSEKRLILRSALTYDSAFIDAKFHRIAYVCL